MVAVGNIFAELNILQSLGWLTSRYYTAQTSLNDVYILLFLNLNETFKFFFKKYFIYIFLERGKRRERGRETSMCGCLSHAPNWVGAWRTTQACALTGNWAGDPLVLKPALSPLILTSQGSIFLNISLHTASSSQNELMRR